MINEIIKFENIGTPNYLIKLSHLVENGSYNEDNINDFFVNKQIDDNTIFDGGVFLLKKIGFFGISTDNSLIIPNEYQHFLKNDKSLINKIILLFIDKWIVDISFNEIFNNDTVYHDLELSIIVDNKAFKFKYSKLKQFLINFQVISIHPFRENCFYVNNKYKIFFDKNIISEIKKRNLSLQEFNKLQNLKNKYGEEGEHFVLNFEKQKFHNHALVDAIEQISHINSSAGYDISSLQDNNSTIVDKFIEVKSYSEIPRFYWSLNEVNVAKEEGDNYFLYLVDRNKINEDGYTPIMIQNPYQEVYKKHNKECQSWKFNFSTVHVPN